MGRRKSVQKIPKRVTIKCPHCSANNRIDVPIKDLVTKFECRKCKQMIETPIMQCCVICAFSKYKCPYNLLLEANKKGLEIRI